jgi:quercetin dioxygenase-like cupin family protein
MSVWGLDRRRAWIFFGAVLGSTLLPAHDVSRIVAHRSSERTRIVLNHALPPLHCGHLKASVVEVHYGPGESSPPHTHPCPVIGYVTQGAYRSQVESGPEVLYKAGDTFYEEPNRHHVLSANASTTEPAAFIAVFVCDHDDPLSPNIPAGGVKTRSPQ